METYTVKLEGNGISYTPSVYGCDECGWQDSDRSFFYIKGSELVCSLHREE